MRPSTRYARQPAACHPNGSGAGVAELRFLIEITPLEPERAADISPGDVKAADDPGPGQTKAGKAAAFRGCRAQQKICDDLGPYVSLFGPALPIGDIVAFRNASAQICE
jgi:hypothetical protein